MGNSRSTEAKVGFTVFVGLMLIVFVLAWAKNVDLTSKRVEFNINFDNIAGLELGDAVTINGLRKGYVENIRSEHDRVIVTVTMEDDIDLREDATFSIMMLDLMGGKKIEVTPGSSSVPLDYATLQQGKFSGDISSAMVMLSSVQNDLVDVIKDVKYALSEINTKLLNSSLPEDIKATAGNFRNISAKLDVMLDENRKGISELIKSGNSLVNTAETVLNENKDKIPQITNKIESLLNETKSLITEINSVVKETKSGDNNLGKLLYDKEMVVNLKQTVDKLNVITEILLKQLQEDGLKVDAYIF